MILLISKKSKDFDDELKNFNKKKLLQIKQNMYFMKMN